MSGDSKKYSYMEPVLQQINKNFVSLPEEMKKENNIYQTVIKTVIEKMKETSPLFAKLHREIFYGGSYYDGLKISKPEEYDLDLLLELPKYAKPEMTPSDLPGFVNVQLTEFARFQQQPEYKSYYADFPKLLDDNHYLHTENVMKWMQSVLTKTLNKFEKAGDQFMFICEQIESDYKKFFIKVVTSGPAFTLQITNKKMKMDVDLVPCFVFDNNWPVHCGFKENPTPLWRTYFIVPKKPRTPPKDGLIGRCWRMSFQIQERDLIKDKKSLKPALKLLKKFRDRLDHVAICSYFLKTIFLHEIDKTKDDNNFWISDLSFTFMEMLKKYHWYLEQKSIPYYWDKNYNMISHLKPITIENLANKVSNIIKEIDRNPNDPLIVAKYLLNQEEINKLKENLPITKESSPERPTVFRSSMTPIKNNDVLYCISDSSPWVTISNDSNSNISRSSSSNQEGTQSQLQNINEKLNQIISMQQLLMSKMDGLNDRVTCIELKMNSSAFDFK